MAMSAIGSFIMRSILNPPPWREQRHFAIAVTSSVAAGA
jgi:hypothetical protein